MPQDLITEDPSRRNTGRFSGQENHTLIWKRVVFPGVGGGATTRKKRPESPSREPRPPDYVRLTAYYQPLWTSVTFPYQSLVT
jgi:hypothetical protein